MKNNKIIILAQKSDAAHIAYHFLKKDIEIDSIIFEKPLSRKKFLSKRIKKLGLLHVLGQILFQLLIPKLLMLSNGKRIQEIIHKNQFNTSAPAREKTIEISSVNSQECINILQEKKPDLIIVKGTRIISQKTLNSIDCPFVNIHAGITPYYRGVHGAYWALVNHDKNRCGVTVHLVDKGIDTGTILKQKIITPNTQDNYLSYPFLQLSAGLHLLKECIPSLLERKHETIDSKEKGNLWHHPTLWGYLKTWILNGIK